MVFADAVGHKGSSGFASSDGCCGPACIESRKGKVLPKGAKCELVDYNSLPNYLKDNQFILYYYRAEWPLKQTFLSLFSLHNETLNIWTHLLGFFFFLALVACAATALLQRTCYSQTDNLHGAPGGANPHLPPQHTAANLSKWVGEAGTAAAPPCTTTTTTFLKTQFFPCHYLHGPAAICSPQASLAAVSNHTDGDEGRESSTGALTEAAPAPRWPFFTYLCGVMSCLMVSSVCHLLSCHSQRFLYVLRGLDYTGITVLIVTSFYPVVYYSFMCDAVYRHLYLALITASGLAMVGVSLVPSFQGPKHRMLRAGLFFCMGVSGVVPIMHKAVKFRDRQAALVTTAYEAGMGALYVMATAVYAARVPERWMPGRFDLLGQSHHFFHVLVMAAAYTHYLGAVVYLRWRDSEGC